MMMTYWIIHLPTGWRAFGLFLATLLWQMPHALSQAPIQPAPGLQGVPPQHEDVGRVHEGGNSQAGSFRRPPVAGADAREAENASAMLEQMLQGFVDRHTAGWAGRVEITLGTLDKRLPLSSCAYMEPFVPPGTRLWGRTSIGIRCREGARWSVMIPLHVRVFAPVAQAARALQPGQRLSVEDFEMIETDLTREAPGVLTSPETVSSHVLSRPVGAGTLLRRDQFRALPVAAPGEQITLVYSGPGFFVTGSGKLLQSAIEGQQVRVQVESGRILSGIVKGGRRVEILD